MGLKPVRLAVGMILGLSLPAVAHNHQGATDKADCCQQAMACCDDDKACCDDGMHMGRGQACDHDGADCDEACRTACDHDGKSCREHGHGRHRVEKRVMMMRGGPRHMGGEFGIKYLANQAQNTSYVLLSMEHAMTRYPRQGQWWNPSAGMGWNFGMDPFAQDINRHLAYMGPVLKNTSVFGPMSVTVGALAGYGFSFDTTRTLDFQNANHYLVLDPRIELGWQLGRQASLQLTGSYLLTSRPAVMSGPSAGIAMRYGF